MSAPPVLTRALLAGVVAISVVALVREAADLAGPGIDAVGTRPSAAFALLALVAAVTRPEKWFRTVAASVAAGVALSAPFGGAGMSNETAICLGAASAAVVLLDRHRRLAAEALSLGVIVLAGLALLANLYGVRQALTLGEHAGMQSSSAIALVLMAVALLLEVPDGLARWIQHGTDPGAILQRKLLPIIFVLLPSLGGLRLLAANANWYDERFGIALNIVVATSVLTAITLRLGFALHRVDDARARAIDELHQLTKDLEDRVRIKAEQLEHERTRVALLSDRNRIARDLHDRVIQRIFAAGLQLTEVNAATSGSADVIDRVVDDLNDGIRELRETIFQLELSPEVDPERALVSTAHRLEPILGFAPTVHIEGDATRMDPAMADHVLAVAHEALINIAKHAGAGRADVRLLISADEVCLAVEDNGCGIPSDRGRDSGLQNIRSRATELGGSARWRSVAPNGTRLEFHAPLAV